MSFFSLNYYAYTVNPCTVLLICCFVYLLFWYFFCLLHVWFACLPTRHPYFVLTHIIFTLMWCDHASNAIWSFFPWCQRLKQSESDKVAAVETARKLGQIIAEKDQKR